MLSIRRAHPDEYEAIGALTADAYAPVLTFGEADPYREPEDAHQRPQG